MSNLVRSSLFFISGAAIASFVTYKVVEKKFKDIADEEIESVKERYERKLEEAKVKAELKQVEIAPIDKVKAELKQVEIAPIDKVISEVAQVTINPYSSLVDNLGYLNNEKETNENMENNNIEVIPPEDFGEYGYKCESLTFYDIDKVLTLYDDTKITDVEQFIGPNALNTFGDYEDDSVFVRNHGMKTDFEILKDNRRYSEVVLGDAE